MNNLKAQSLGIPVPSVLGMAVGSGDTPASVSAHGGNASVVHACVNETNAETLGVRYWRCICGRSQGLSRGLREGGCWLTAHPAFTTTYRIL